MILNKQFVLIFVCVFISVSSNVLAQSTEGSYKISGFVTDEGDEGLPMATITVGESGKGMLCDANGRFTITLTKKPSVLNFSYVGMEKQSVKVDETTKTLVVKLKSKNQLKEVVIEGGYGLAQKRSDMVGSAYQVKSKDLENLPMGRIDKLLDGLVPGVTVEPNSDSPGSPRTRYNIRVRGDASLAASNEPLWIIDGVPVYQGSSTNMMPGTSYTVSPLSYINPSDIESITVLKDASQTSLYGANGANGVILVKTKAGIISEKTLVDVSLRYGISNIDKSTSYKVMNAAQYLTYAKEAWINSGQDINAFPYQDNELNSYSTTNTNWENLYFGTAQSKDIGVSLKGGSKNNQNFASFSYHDESETVLGNQQQRFSARINNDYKLKKLTINTILSASYNKNNLFALSHEYYETLPIFSPYENDGYTNRLYNRIVSNVTYDSNNKPVLTWTDRKFYENSIPDREDNTNIQKTYNVDASLILKYQIIEGLDFTEQFGANIETTNEEIYSARTTLDGLVNDKPAGESRRASANYFNWDNVLRLNFNKTFGNYKVGALAGTEFQNEQYNTLYATGSGFLNDHIQEVGYSESSSRTGSSSSSQKRMLSYLGEVNLAYKSKYFLVANARADGNSSFGKYVRWGNFGSIGMSWIVSKEDFFKSRVFKLLKFKSSIGTNGNSRIDSSVSTGTYSYDDTYSYGGIPGAVSSSVANPGLSWETTTMFNSGVRTTLWDRVDVELEYYNNYTKNLLTKIYTSRTISDDRLYANVGEMRNQGIELTINSVNIKTKNFEWDTDVNFSHNVNKITKMYNGMTTSFGTTVWSEGHEKGAFYLVRWAGVDPASGAPMWYDKNGNITFTYSTDNRVIMNLPTTPWATGGLINTLKYKDFSLRVMFNYTFGGYTPSTLVMRGLQDGYDVTSGNVDVDAFEHWSQPGDLSVNPRISTVSSKSAMSSTRYLYSQTSINLQNIALTYQIPRKILNKIGIESSYISLISDNLYLWTPDQSSTHNSYKTVKNGYPVQRGFSLSLQLGL